MKLVTASRPQLQVMEAGIEIDERRAVKRDAAYMAKEMVLCTLPHSDPGDVASWMRDSGDARLFIQPGVDKNGKLLGIPYGTTPRLLLFWLMGEILRKGERKIWLTGTGDEEGSLSGFMRQLGMNSPSGGKRSDAFRLKDAMLRLFASRIILLRQVKNENGKTVHERTSFEVASRELLWWDKDNLDAHAPTACFVVIGQDFFNAVLASAVPCDIRAIKALQKSPLALDLYALLNYFGANSPRDLTWAELQRRLGTNYADLANLKKKVQLQLPNVLHVHPGLRASIISGGLRIEESEPAIPRLSAAR